MPSRILMIFLLVAVTGLWIGCGSGASSPPPQKEVVVAVPAKTGVYGPPPHAPAHGYRHKHGHGVDLIFDSSLEVYVVAGTSKRYWWAGNFYRKRGNQWQLSANLDGPWNGVNKNKVPHGLTGTKVKSKKNKKATVN